jgi:hypothetical protein
VTDKTVKGRVYNKHWHTGYYSGWGRYGESFYHTHGHEGWRCKKPKNIEWWKHLEKDNGYDGMIIANVNVYNKLFWVHKEYKHEADIYCDEWEIPYWYTQF